MPTPRHQRLTCVADDDELEEVVLVGEGLVSDHLIGLFLQFLKIHDY